MKKWYNIRKKHTERWYAYEIEPEQLARLKRGYEYTGPYDSFIKAFAAAMVDKRKPQVFKPKPRRR